MRITVFCKCLYSIAITLQYCILGTISIDVSSTTPRHVQEILAKTNLTQAKQVINGSRRILYGQDVTAAKLFMVYLKLPPKNLKYDHFKNWLCGGAIIHDEYILTSAACIEDVKHFYVVSGTYRHADDNDEVGNLCIKYGAKKAIWKCIPRNYVFDGHENDNLRWLNNDIAIVKVEDEFDFTRRVRGCDFIPKPVSFNNDSAQLEKPGVVASIAGWGSLNMYSEWINRRASQTESPQFPRILQQASVTIISKTTCKNRWGQRYHNIIDNYMICTKDTEVDLSDLCQHTYSDCTDIMYDTNEEMGRRRYDYKNKILSSNLNKTRRAKTRLPGSGGFCENDHGGPLVYDNGKNAVVIGVISACLVREKTNRCYGPFLYTSVYKNRKLINCAIYKDKDTQGECNKLFRAGESYDEHELSWIGHPDGPSKADLKKMRRQRERPVNITETNLTIETHTNSTH